MGKRPSFQFYPKDWLADPSLRSLSYAARGLWWDMLCLMFESEKKGYLQIKGVPVTPEQLARMTGGAEGGEGGVSDEVARLLAELEAVNVFSRTAGGVIYSRRMVRDEGFIEKRRQWGQLGAEHGQKGAKYGHLGGRPRVRAQPPLNPPENGVGGGFPETPLKPPPSSSSSSVTTVTEEACLRHVSPAEAAGDVSRVAAPANPLLGEAEKAKSAERFRQDDPEDGSPPAAPVAAAVMTVPSLGVSPAAFLEAWNMAGLTPCRKLTSTRLQHFRARAADSLWRDSWREALTRATASSFCRGGGDRGWRATVDWFLRPDTVAKILEGTYDDRPGKPGATSGRGGRVNAPPGKYANVGTKVRLSEAAPTTTDAAPAAQTSNPGGTAPGSANGVPGTFPW